jgi:hypothetical protein
MKWVLMWPKKSTKYLAECAAGGGGGGSVIFQELVGADARLASTEV